MHLSFNRRRLYLALLKIKQMVCSMLNECLKLAGQLKSLGNSTLGKLPTRHLPQFLSRKVSLKAVARLHLYLSSSLTHNNSRLKAYHGVQKMPSIPINMKTHQIRALPTHTTSLSNVPTKLLMASTKVSSSSMVHFPAP